MKVFKLVMAVFMALALSGPAGAQATETRFLSAINDIPLMPGLYELTRETVVFDKPEGRIVQSSAVSETAQTPEIRAFYGSALPQLGWQAEPAGGAADSYLRQDEKLVISLETREGLNIVHFSLSPRP